jgi:hypothetical protein
MPVLQKDLRWYGSAVMPEDEATLAIGGAIATATKPEFIDCNGLVQVISSAAGDTTQTVTIHYRAASGAILNEVKTLNGTTAVTYAATMDRLMKLIKSATTTGDVAVEHQTATRSNTAQAGAADTITLDASASGTDDFYNGQVIRLTGGTGSGQIRQIIDYVGSTKVAHVSRDWGTNPNGTSTFRIAPGCVFDKSPHEITTIRRPFYGAAADPTGGVTRKYYEKLFAKNGHATLALLAAQVKEGSDPSTIVAFGVASTLDDSGTNGGGNNRQVAPGGITFDSADKNMANSATLTAGAAQGVWLELTLAVALAATKTTYLPDLVGNSA